VFEFGGSRTSAELLPRLAGFGHRIRVIAEAPPPVPGEKRSSFTPTAPGLTVVPFALRYRSARTLPDPVWITAQRARLTALLGHLVDDQRPDLVLLGRETLAWYALDVCRELHVPALVTVHGSPTAALEHGIYPPEAVEALIAHLRTAAGLVTVAHHLRLTLARLGAPGAVTVRNVVDPQRFAPRDKDPTLLRELDIHPARRVVASFSNLRPEKRIGDLVDAAPRVLAEQPDTVFVLAGGGMLAGELPREVEQRGLADSFRFPGEVENAEMPRWLSVADLVVSPSEREGYPLTVLEAQAAGRAVIASDIAATREIEAAGRPLATFPLGDSGALAGVVLDLLDHTERRIELGRAARDAAKGDNPDQWAREHERVIAEVAERATRRA
jgi:glycosyltransferase involved in cell wall biosynthesis